MSCSGCRCGRLPRVALGFCVRFFHLSGRAVGRLFTVAVAACRIAVRLRHAIAMSVVRNSSVALPFVFIIQPLPEVSSIHRRCGGSSRFDSRSASDALHWFRPRRHRWSRAGSLRPLLLLRFFLGGVSDDVIFAQVGYGRQHG